jgi:hypothetical protein
MRCWGNHATVEHRSAALGEPVKSRVGQSRLLAVASTAALLIVLLVPGTAWAGKNATLVHVGKSGLESYNAWTKKSTRLVSGMVGTWGYPVLSPNGISVVTMKNNRADRAYMSEIYGALMSSSAPAAELSIGWPEGGIGMTSLLGWLDDYRVVWQQDDPGNFNSGDQATMVVDVRNPGAWSYYSGPVTYPSTARKPTNWDRACRTHVSVKGVVTITRRTNKKRVARFTLPGFGGGKHVHGWYTGWQYWSGDRVSISPDGKFVAYELFSEPRVGSSYAAYRTYVCTIKGQSAKRIKNDNGGFVWR